MGGVGLPPVDALIVQGDVAAAAAVRAALRPLQARCIESFDPLAAWSALRSRPFDIVILDLALGAFDGSAVLRKLRGAAAGGLPDPKTPVVVTGRSTDLRYRVRALNAGADRYLVKPFAAAELAAIVRAVTRRRGSVGAALVCGELAVDPGERICTLGRVQIDLTHSEMELLVALLRAHPEVLRKESPGGGPSAGAFASNAMHVHVHNLRRKLGPRAIETVRNVGYRLRTSCSSRS